MASRFDWEELRVPEIIDGMTAFLVAPVILTVASAVKQPGVQSAIKGGITLAERCKEAWAETTETIENLAAEVNSELIAQKQAQSNSQSYVPSEQFDIGGELMHALSEANLEMRRLTNGLVDWRLIVPLGLGSLAIRQLLIKGLQLDEIPWYTLAWYAFDSFAKLNDSSESSS
jgi:hypothetical protein